MSESPNRISLNKGYRAGILLEKVFHLHLRISRRRDLWDYLCQHPDIAQAYQELKLSLWFYIICLWYMINPLERIEKTILHLPLHDRAQSKVIALKPSWQTSLEESAFSKTYDDFDEVSRFLSEHASFFNLGVSISYLARILRTLETMRWG